MDDDAGGLVDDEQVLVLPGDLERNGVVGHERARDRCGRLVRQLLPALEPVALHARLLAVDRDETFGEHPLGDRARADVVERREEPVEPLARRLGAGRRASLGGTAAVQRRPSLRRHHRDEQDDHAGDDERVGEVERRPPAQVEEVGDVAEPDAVDEVPGAPADEEPERDRAARDAARRSGRSRRPSR